LRFARDVGSKQQPSGGGRRWLRLLPASSAPFAPRKPDVEVKSSGGLGPRCRSQRDHTKQTVPGAREPGDSPSIGSVCSERRHRRRTGHTRCICQEFVQNRRVDETFPGEAGQLRAGSPHRPQVTGCYAPLGPEPSGPRQPPSIRKSDRGRFLGAGAEACQSRPP